MFDTPVEELPVQDAGAPDQVVLVSRAAIDVDEPQPTESGGVPIELVTGIPCAPACPDLAPPLDGLQVEREVDSHLLAPGIRRVVRRHADRVQDGLHLMSAPVRLPPIPSEPVRRASAPPECREG